MKEKKNIDRIYQEKFKDFEREPDERLWGNIASRLDKEEEKEPVLIPLWWKIGGVAAVLAIVIASLLFTQNQSPLSNEPGVVIEEIDNSPETEPGESIHNKNEAARIESPNSIAEEENSAMQGGQENSNSSQSLGTKNNTQEALAKQDNLKKDTKKESALFSKNTAVAQQTSQTTAPKNEKEEDAINPVPANKADSGMIAENEPVKIDSISPASLLEDENELAKIEEEKEKSKDEEEAIAEADLKRMRLSTFAAPVFYKNIGNGNELSNQLAENGSSSEVTLSYGVKVAYQLSEKLRIRTGISKVDINNSTQGIAFSPAMASSFENLSLLEDNIEIRNNNSAPSPAGEQTGPLPTFTGDSNTALTTAVATPGEIRQQFGYIEIPLELEYALIDKRFGLNIIGGGSSLFLDHNRVDLVSGESRTRLGEATNINSTSFSTNIGLGLDYKLTEKFSLSMEPIFKYQLNTFNNVDNVQPVNFGVYSGINFRF
ncbi:hypothetical protein GCM10023115_35210 [Pontixanthobacter gangjinensis]|uniref:PorT family protein n=1 Tax=Christiangramia aestuarii TaxID=1028746 RepID=A0A7K1LS58_9FLAO|nr:hypothetical protein [Christiangramia aestuarii]MUP43310.1 PorT family protein [Christiangramia aestuarii]